MTEPLAEEPTRVYIGNADELAPRDVPVRFDPEDGQPYLAFDGIDYDEARDIAEDSFGAEVVGKGDHQYRRDAFRPLTETYGQDVPAVVLAEGTSDELGFDTPYGKTAKGVVMHSDVFDVGAVIDSSCESPTAAEVVLGDTEDARTDLDHLADIPVVGSFDEAYDETPGAEAMVIGMATEGGFIPDGWNPMINGALDEGMDLFSGLHNYLSTTPEYARRAAEGGARIYDVRQPPHPDEGTVAGGKIDGVDADIVYVAGTDCAVGKRTTAADLTRAAEDRGYEADMVATGQTGILLGHPGVAADALTMDFTSGALERLAHETAQDNDIVFIEGQGSVLHPAWFGTHAGLRASQPDAIVLADDPDREAHVAYGDEETGIAPVGDQIEALERHGDTRDPNGRTAVAAIATWSDEPAGEEYPRPAANIMQEGGTEKLLESVEAMLDGR